MRRAPIGWVALLSIALGCASNVARETRLEQWQPGDEQRVAARLRGDRSPELLVLLAFSGGGTRAAAFAYGVLEELAATEVWTAAGRRELHHEIDAISSVSGGSFTAAYFALAGDAIFEEFEPRFLRKDVEAALVGRVFDPLNWTKLASGGYGRSDLAAEYYAEHLFDHATFADLEEAGGPLLFINATELGSGVRFPFSRLFFDLLCADYDAYPVARAVAASSAVPGLLSPISLENYAGTCGYQPGDWLAADAEATDTTSIEHAQAAVIMEFLDREKRPWLHLVDGGISDNLGLRAYLTRGALAGDLRRAFPSTALPGGHQILVVLVNAVTRHTPDWVASDHAPSLLEVLGAVTDIELGRYDLDSIELMSESFEHWASESSTTEDPIHFELVEVSFDEVVDTATREALNRTGTNFDLSDAEVDRLIEAARTVLRESPGFRAFLAQNRDRFGPPGRATTGAGRRLAGSADAADAAGGSPPDTR